MKKSDIYEAAIKIGGIYLFISAFGSLITGLSLLIQTSLEDNIDSGEIIVNLVSLIAILIVTLIIPFILIFKTDWIIKKICRPSDFEETINLSVERKIVYEIILIITGILLILWTLPDFAFRLVNYIRVVQSGVSVQAYDKNFLIISALKVFIGTLAIFESRHLSAFLARKERTSSDS